MAQLESKSCSESEIVIGELQHRRAIQWTCCIFAILRPADCTNTDDKQQDKHGAVHHYQQLPPLSQLLCRMVIARLRTHSAIVFKERRANVQHSDVY